MNFTGLSLDQAPPISAPVRFFLTAPLFAMVASILMLLTDATLFSSRYTVESISVVHLFTIGFMAMVMLGALQQMLPVLAGVSIPKASLVATSAHLLISGGLLLMVFGLLTSSALVTLVAPFVLGMGFSILLGGIFLALRKVTFLTPTIRGMRWALFFALLTVVLGVFLLTAYGQNSVGSYQITVANIHAVLGVFGFAGVLIMGVAFQVIPMFYVTPAFHERYQKYLVLSVVVIIALWALFNVLTPSFTWVVKLLLVAVFSGFAYLVLEKMNQRKRPIADITVYYWRLGAVMAFLGLIVWTLSDFITFEIDGLVGTLLGGGFVMSIMMGMLYKIIPFLVWFHLNGMGYMSIPSMGEMVNKKWARIQFSLFVLSLLFFSMTPFEPMISKLGAVTLFVSMLILEVNLLNAYKNYGQTLKRAPDFDMSMMQSA